MDIKGAEIEAIKGAGYTLRNNKIDLAIASYHVVNGQQTCIELEKLLSEMVCISITDFPGHLTKYASKATALLSSEGEEPT